MSYNHTYAQIKDILKSNPKITKDVMLQVAQLAIIETMGSELPEGTEIKCCLLYTSPSPRDR